MSSFGSSEKSKKELSFRGKKFYINVYDTDSEWLFLDELDIAEKYWNVKEGDVVVDVGASYGVYTIYSLLLGATYVYAFEPNKYKFKIMLENIFSNNLGGEVNPIMSFVGDGTIKPFNLQPTTESKEGLPLDSLIPITHKINWIKVDVEGYELEVIRGAQNIIEQHKPNLYIEDHTSIYDFVKTEQKMDKLKDIIKPYGYNFESVPFKNRAMLICKV
jgi:FkbM family methyltransferase